MPTQVLVVDQNPSVQTTIENALLGKGFSITSVRDALSGLDLAYKIKPDIIIADLRIEGLMIYSFCARIRQKNFLSNIPIFLLVQQNDVYDEARLRQSGAVGFIKKPIDVKELSECLNPYLINYPGDSATPNSEAGGKEIIQTERVKESQPVNKAPEKVESPEFKLAEIDQTKSGEPAKAGENYPSYQEETVKIEDLLGWSSDEVSPFSEVISSEDETQFYSLTQMLEEASPSPSDTKTAGSDTLLDSTKTKVDSKVQNEPLEEKTDFPDISKTKIDSKFLDETPSKEKVEEKTEEKDQTAYIHNGKNTFHEASSMPANLAVQLGKDITPDISNLTKDIIEKVAWEVVPHLTEQALNKELITSMVEKVIWDVVPHIAEISVKEAIKKITDSPD